ncbi:hypothetical protein [Streptomyces sp. WAC01280]|uniref:hypothetical protein n=1 Tax=Streptomyces sp. WAC01280 TaxID=2487424 RepID=UPI00163CF218|nr:hypothetical protein [Streptomyces sp. WAC01280]
MAIEPTAGEQALIDQYALPWIEANEDGSSAADGGLRAYASSLENDGADATKAVQRLVSSGKGEALKALEAHWSRVHAYFGQTNRAAIAIAAEIQASGDTIVIGKHRAQDLIAHLSTSGAGASNDAQHTMLMERQADITRQDLQANVKTTLSEAKAGAARAQGDPDVASLGSIPSTLAGLLGGAEGGLGRGAGGGVADGIGAGGGVANGIGTGGADGIGVGAGVAAGIAGAGGRSGMRGHDEGGTDGVGGPGGSAGMRGQDGGPQVGTNAGNWNIFLDHGEHKRAANSLAATAEKLYGQTTQALARARYDLDTLSAGGSLGASITADYAPLLDHLDGATRALANHLDGPLRDLVLGISTDQQKTDEANRDRIGWMN